MPGYRKLGRDSAHRKAMLRNLVTDLLREGRISTTDTRAKEAGRMTEKMITLAKRGDLHARRQVLGFLYDETVVSKLFEEIAPEYADRNGGYTRILKLCPLRRLRQRVPGLPPGGRSQDGLYLYRCHRPDPDLLLPRNGSDRKSVV